MDRRIVGGNGRRIQQARTRKDGWTQERRKLFLDSLATECNVRLAEKAAGMGQCAAYALRQRDPVFAQLWREALALGYERLEAALLRRALIGVNDITIEGGEPALAGLDPQPDAEGAGEARDGASPCEPQPGSGVPRPRASVTEMQAAMALLSKHRASVEGSKGVSRHRRRATDEETDAALKKQLDARAKRLRKEEA